MRLKTTFGTIVAGLIFATNAHAGIVAQAGAQSFATVTASEDFESFAPFASPTNPFSSGGFNFGLPGTAGLGFIVWSGPGFSMSSQFLYNNGGGKSILDISLTSGANFDQLQFNVDYGALINPIYVWLETFNNGAPTGYNFDFDVAGGTALSVRTDGSTDFDEVRVATYRTSAVRDQHNEQSPEATAIDNVIAGTRTNIAAPEPLTISIFGAVSRAWLSCAVANRG